MNDDVTSRRRLVTNRRLLWLLAIAVLLVLLVLLIAENFILVEIRLIVGRVHVRLAWALLVAFLTGGVVGGLVARGRWGPR